MKNIQTANFRELTEGERAYIAGIFDGEGSIGLNAYAQHRSWHFSLRVCVVNTSSVLLEWLAATTGLGRTEPLRSGQKDGWKACWVWNVRREEALWLLPRLLPYLIVKKRQAEIALRFLDLRGDEHRIPEDAIPEMFSLREEIGRLNQRGLKVSKSGERIERVIPDNGVCENCGGVVDRSRYTAKRFCSPACQTKAWREARKERQQSTS